MKNKEFKVLLMDINKNTYEEYDILPYFRREWKIRPFGRDEKYKKIPVTTKPQLRESGQPHQNTSFLLHTAMQ